MLGPKKVLIILIILYLLAGAWLYFNGGQKDVSLILTGPYNTVNGFLKQQL